MTDVRQFGDLAARSFDCARCEAMLADAVDGMLPAEEQQFFDAHIADCSPCEQLLTEARRGAAWLEMLRTPAPEPPPALLEKILTQTSGTMLHPISPAHPVPALAPGYTNVLPFPNRAAAAMRGSALGRIAFEPRLAMTAAMAFFSIALTMDLMGVNPMDLRANDLTPSGLHRAFADVDARVSQYYEGLRVVYELESRVHDFQSIQDNAQEGAQGAAPAQNQNQSQTPAASVTDQSPADDGQATPDQDDSAPQAAPNQQQPEDSAPKQPMAQPKAPPNGGISRREETRPTQIKGPLAAFTRNKHAAQPAVSDATEENAIADYLGGISSAVYPIRPHGGHSGTAPAPDRASPLADASPLAERRAA